MVSAEKLKMIRTHYKLSQIEFAEKLGVSRSTYTNIEQGRTAATPRLINTVAAIFHIDREMLEDDDKEDNSFLNSLIDDAILEKYRKLKPTYRECAEKQLDQLLELQKREENATESPVDQTTSPMTQ